MLSLFIAVPPMPIEIIVGAVLGGVTGAILIIGTVKLFRTEKLNWPTGKRVIAAVGNSRILKANLNHTKS